MLAMLVRGVRSRRKAAAGLQRCVALDLLLHVSVGVSRHLGHFELDTGERHWSRASSGPLALSPIWFTEQEKSTMPKNLDHHRKGPLGGGLAGPPLGARPTDSSGFGSRPSGVGGAWSVRLTLG